MTAVVRVATRGSDLALTQARYVAERLRVELEVDAELVEVQTTGDRIQDVSLAKIGGKGLFIKEIEEALLDDRADVAVHSAKDLPAELAGELELIAFPQRADFRDALVTRDPGGTLAQLRPGARVGTGSARRTAQLLAQRPDLEIVALRGNVPTRLRKLVDDDLDAVVLACAGLDRLGLSDRIDERISPDAMLPAVAQGTLALETRRGDALGARIAALDDPPTAVSAAAERGFLERIGGDCSVPMGCLAQRTATGRLRVRGLLASADGGSLIRDELETENEKARAGGAELAERMLAAGGEALLASLRADFDA